MSAKAWEVVKNARSTTIKIINSEAEKIPAKTPGIHLSKRLLEAMLEMESEPTKAAIEYIKNEVAMMI